MRENNPESDFLIILHQNTNPRPSSKKISENCRPSKVKIPQEVMMKISEVPIYL
jgi:hypothetical protein